MFTYTLNGEPLTYGSFVTGAEDALVNHPASVLEYWSDAELAAIGVVRTSIPPPEPARPTVRKSTVVNRLITAGKIDSAMAAIMSNASAFARWTAPDWPNVYQDDEEVVAMLLAIGADPATILAAE